MTDEPFEDQAEELGAFDFEAAAEEVAGEPERLRDFLAAYGFGDAEDGEGAHERLTRAAFADTVVCAFELLGQTFAIEVTAVREVLEVDAVHAVPLAPEGLLGLASVRGTMLGIVDLASVLGLEGFAMQESAGVQVLVLDTGGLLFGARIDRALGIGPAFPVDELDFGAEAAPDATSGRIALDRQGQRTALRIDPPRLHARICELTRAVSRT